jgi:hypothetical protein
LSGEIERQELSVRVAGLKLQRAKIEGQARAIRREQELADLKAADDRARLLQRREASRIAMASLKAKRAADERKRNCPICRDEHAFGFNAEQLAYHHAGHPRNWNWEPADSATARRLDRLEAAIAMLVEALKERKPPLRIASR